MKKSVFHSNAKALYVHGKALYLVLITAKRVADIHDAKKEPNRGKVVLCASLNTIRKKN